MFLLLMFLLPPVMLINYMPCHAMKRNLHPRAHWFVSGLIVFFFILSINLLISVARQLSSPGQILFPQELFSSPLFSVFLSFEVAASCFALLCQLIRLVCHFPRMFRSDLPRIQIAAYILLYLMLSFVFAFFWYHPAIWKWQSYALEDIHPYLWTQRHLSLQSSHLDGK